MISKVKVLGERNSGTNFVEQFLVQNFAVELFSDTGRVPNKHKALVRASHSNRRLRAEILEAFRDQQHFDSVAATGGWKHSAPNRAFLKEFAEPSGAHIVCVIRHPAAWLKSMHRNPFHALSEVPESFSTFIRAPWIARARDQIDSIALNHPIDLYLSKFTAYQWLKSVYPRCTVLRYEDVLMEPKKTAQRELSFLARQKNEISLPDQNARHFVPDPKTTKDYLAGLRSATYDNLSDSDRAHVLQALEGSPLLEVYPD